jgi:hypothetical protein
MASLQYQAEKTPFWFHGKMAEPKNLKSAAKHF